MNCKARTPITLLVAASLAVAAAPAWASAKPNDGKTLFTKTHKCDLCHAVPAAGIEARSKAANMAGPELGGKVDAGVEEIRAHLDKTPGGGDRQSREGFKGTDEEVSTILDWLGSFEPEK